METSMRFMITVGAVAVAVVAGACDGAEPTATTPGSALVSPGTSAEAARGSSGAAAAGRTDATRLASPSEPVWEHVTIPAGPVGSQVTFPAGTPLPVVLDTSVGSDTSRSEQPVAAHLSHAVTLHGDTVLPEGSKVAGVVTDVKQSAKVKGLAHIALRFDSVTPRGDDQRYEIRTSAVGRTAEATKQKDAVKIAAPAAGGAIVGALIGGKKGALIGTAAG